LVIWQVDDDPVHLFLAARLIRRANPTAEIVSFENAREAAEKLALERPDVLMPRSEYAGNGRMAVS
jgi:DNA-binding NtrC family response regulator